MKKVLNKILLSKGMGKVLDSKISKKVMIPLGKKVMKTFPISSAIKKEREFLNSPGEKLKKENEMEKTGQVAKKKGRSTSDGRMLG